MQRKSNHLISGIAFITVCLVVAAIIYAAAWPRVDPAAANQQAAEDSAERLADDLERQADQAEAALARPPEPLEVATMPAVPEITGGAGEVQAALDQQMLCHHNPQSGRVMRALIANNMIAETERGGDGSTVYKATALITVLGHQVVAMRGWEGDESGAVKPFWRGPGTSPPLFLEVSLSGTKSEIEQALQQAGSEAELNENAADDELAPGQVTITCLGDY